VHWHQAGEVQDQEQEDQNDDHDPKHVHPAWSWWWLSPAAEAPAGVEVDWVGGRFSHVRVLSWGRVIVMTESLPDGMSMRRQTVSPSVATYPRVVPRLWNDTIEAHRRAVREATLDTIAALVAKHGLRSVTMSQIAEETGIGRATLYKYFPDVEAILVAWHERHVTAHLQHLSALRDQAGDAAERLEAVLEAFALIQHKRHATELGALLHRDEHIGRAQQHLTDLIRDLLIECAEAGDVRDDVAPDELASYCLHALAAASGLPSEAAVRRLVTVTLAGLRPPSDSF
jgi:AcrR family transcriptional regulator